MTEELRRYVAHFRPHRRPLFIATAMLLISAAIPAATLAITNEIFEDIRAGRVDRLGWLATGLVAAVLAGTALSLARTALTKRVAWTVTDTLRRRLHAHQLRLSPEQQRRSGERIAALTHDVDELQYGVSAIVTVVRNPIMLVGLVVAAVVAAPTLAAWVLVALPLVLIPIRWGGERLRRRGREARQTRAALTGLMQEQQAGLRTIQAFDAHDAEMVRFGEVAVADREARIKADLQRIQAPAVVEVAGAAAMGLLAWYGGTTLATGRILPEDMLVFLGALALMRKPLAELSEVWSLMQRSLAALERVEETLAEPPAIEQPSSVRDLPAGPLAIRWERVVVDYGDGPVLRGVTLDVPAGGMLALVGATGGGKSTLLRLIPRFRDVTTGCVTIGGVDVRAIALGQLRRAVAVVQQEGFLFARTVAENVRLGRPDATDAEVRSALEQAGAASFVDGLPRGADTLLNELGQRLSGGQVQRLCLARALLMDAPVLLLDEATNQVDAQTERVILDALHAVRGGRTVILIAHNLTAVRHADQIAVLDGGQVVELGGHDALVALDGRYAALWRAWLEQEGASS